jgi:sulfur transfer protein SufE
VVSAFLGESPQDVLEVNPNVLGRLGLVEALGMVRVRGLNAILNRILQEVRRAGATGSSNGQ